MGFKQERTVSALSDKCLQLRDEFTYLGSNISFTEIDVKIHLAKVLTVIERLSMIWKSYFSYKMKQDSFLPIRVSVSTTVGKLMKRMEKKLDGNYTRIPGTILNKSWKQYLWDRYLPIDGFFQILY